MEDVILAVVPVRERGMVRACLLNGPFCVNYLGDAGLGPLTLITLVLCFICSFEVHLVRVDDLGLLLKIEGGLVALDLRLCQLLSVVLTIVREERLGVGVADEAVCAASHS